MSLVARFGIQLEVRTQTFCARSIEDSPQPLFWVELSPFSMYEDPYIPGVSPVVAESCNHLTSTQIDLFAFSCQKHVT